MRWFVLLLVFAVVSCREPEEDTGLREKYELQLVELDELQTKLEEVREKNAGMKIPDPSGDVTAMKEELAKLVKEKKEWEVKAAELKAQTEEQQKHLEEYRKKYPLQRN